MYLVWRRSTERFGTLRLQCSDHRMWRKQSRDHRGTEFAPWFPARSRFSRVPSLRHIVPDILQRVHTSSSSPRCGWRCKQNRRNLYLVAPIARHTYRNDPEVPISTVFCIRLNGSSYSWFCPEGWRPVVRGFHFQPPWGVPQRCAFPSWKYSQGT